MASEKQLAAVQNKVMSTFKHSLTLPIMVENPKMRITKCYGGYGVDNLYIEMKSIQAGYTIQNIQNYELVGRRAMILLSHQQLESGISASVLSLKDHPFAA